MQSMPAVAGKESVPLKPGWCSDGNRMASHRSDSFLHGQCPNFPIHAEPPLIDPVYVVTLIAGKTATMDASSEICAICASRFSFEDVLNA